MICLSFSVESAGFHWTKGSSIGTGSHGCVYKDGSALRCVSNHPNLVIGCDRQMATPGNWDNWDVHPKIWDLTETGMFITGITGITGMVFAEARFCQAEFKKATEFSGTAAPLSYSTLVLLIMIIILIMGRGSHSPLKEGHIRPWTKRGHIRPWTTKLSMWYSTL